MSHHHIKVQEKENGAITEITLANPPGNVLSLAMMKEIIDQIKIDENNPHKKLIVFSGEGKHFSYGASVEEHTADKIGDMLPYFHGFLGTIIKSPLPTLAKVKGFCLGGAFELALSCTFICAEESAKVGLPEIILGVFPPAACVLLPARIGEARSAAMILSGDQLDASALRETGVFERLVEKGNLDAAVDWFFEKKLKPKSASSLRIAHRASRVPLADTYDKYIDRVGKMYLNELMKTTDAKEGITAFMEKRPVKWRDG
jgi:cyclohexa-1,5-dienecarbonyl-CoA hydratase